MDEDYMLFATVVEAGSLSAAARRLSISPAMVSKRLARLEDRLGTRLVHRTTRRMALTEIGSRFHADVAEILALTKRAEDRVSGMGSEPAGALRVSLPTSFGRLHVAPHLHGFLARHPMIELEVNLSDAFVDMLAERIDVAIRITAAPPIGMNARRLASSRRLLCASPLYLEGREPPGSVAGLKDHRVLAADGQMPWRLVSGARQAKFDGRSHVRTNSSELVRELAIAGGGIALRSIWDVGDTLASGRLVRVLPEWEGSGDAGIYTVRPGGAPSPAVAAFEAFAAEEIAPRLRTLDALPL